MRSRKEYKIDKVLEWTPPEVLQKFYPGGFFGEDREGSPVYYDPGGLIDLRGEINPYCISIDMPNFHFAAHALHILAGMLCSAKPYDILRYKARVGEMSQRLLQQQSEKVIEVETDVFRCIQLNYSLNRGFVLLFYGFV